MQRGGLESRTVRYNQHIINMERDPVFSKKVSAGTRVYYFDIIVDRKGQPFMSISEIPTDHTPGKKKRQRVVLHADKMERFADAFLEAATHLKTVKTNNSYITPKDK